MLSRWSFFAFKRALPVFDFAEFHRTHRSPIQISESTEPSLASVIVCDELIRRAFSSRPIPLLSPQAPTQQMSRNILLFVATLVPLATAGEIYIDSDETTQDACVRLDSSADALVNFDSDIYLDADEDNQDEACMQLSNTSGTHGQVTAQQSGACQDSWPYPGSALRLQGRGPYSSCADLRSECDSCPCAGLRQRIRTQWCPMTCGTCSGGGSAPVGGNTPSASAPSSPASSSAQCRDK